MSESTGPASFGRVEEDGTVFVTTSAGERRVGQVPDVPPAEALEFFVRRFLALETEVSLAEARIGSGALGGDEARKKVDALTTQIGEANAVGDLDGLLARLQALAPTLAAKQEAKRAERAEAHARTKQAKEGMVTEAEKLAAGNDWRDGVNRFRTLLEEWKALPRIDKATDDDLWHRFSSARTTYTRRRKAQFAERNAARSTAQQAKEQIIAESEELAKTEDFGVGAAGFRDLMNRWKAAGSAPRGVDDKLWARFRAIQDEFFGRRNAVLDEQNAEFTENQKAKEALLDQAEASILPVTDAEAGKAAYRDFLAKFNELGKVPRDAIRTLDDRVRKLDQAVRNAEAEQWRRTDPEARQRAQDTVDMFTAQIDKLTAQRDSAEQSGNSKAAKEADASIATYTSWREQAQKALDEFTA
ncbi:DUF349 domain-containing protein [Aestuariimicrobium sp. T2.26MG-19.2B]|uniref:DUF349 domain-containing protein n=1 Tax=Aestuariimicrobium sp. T2.26MG-19.2B TaxID=3040679 RepID=UPI0025405F90|nr:DUF349 domain-containing protein [Aestuariimicrobium sp. T2.26MG-19.2B]